MDKLHSSMVRQMEGAEMMDQEEVGSLVSQRKTSVSASCQTDKVEQSRVMFANNVFMQQVSRKVSRVSKFVSDEHVSSRVPAPRHSRVSQIVTRVDTEDQEMTPVTRVVTTGIRESQVKEAKVAMSETEGMSNLRKYNNILVGFIEKARVLSEAEQISNSYPSSL